MDIKIAFILSLLIIINSNISISQVNQIYLCRTSENNNILLEDHYLSEKYYQESVKEAGETYDEFSASLINILKANGLFREDKSTYYINKKLTGFDRFTNINIGDVFYLSAPEDVYTSSVKGYAILLDDQIGEGTYFMRFWKIRELIIWRNMQIILLHLKKVIYQKLILQVFQIKR